MIPRDLCDGIVNCDGDGGAGRKTLATPATCAANSTLAASIAASLIVLVSTGDIGEIGDVLDELCDNGDIGGVKPAVWLCDDIDDGDTGECWCSCGVEPAADEENAGGVPGACIP